MSVRQDLIQYRFLLAEVEHLQEVIGELEAERKAFIQTDMVVASDTEYPYTTHKVKIRGIDFTDKEALELNDQYQKLIRKLRRKKVETSRAYIRAMSVIYEAPDIVTRRVLECRFIHGMTWEQTAANSFNITASAARSIASRYIAGKDVRK